MIDNLIKQTISLILHLIKFGIIVALTIWLIIDPNIVAGLLILIIAGLTKFIKFMGVRDVIPVKVINTDDFNKK